MRIVVKTAPLRQWEVEREMRARVKAALDTRGDHARVQQRRELG